MLRSLALFVSAAILLASCSSPAPKAEPARIKPPTPVGGPQQNCDDVLADDPECVAWTAPEPHTFSEVLPISGDEAGVGKGLQWGPYYWCAAITDDVAEKVFGTKDVIRVVASKFYCQIGVNKATGLNNTLSIYLSPYEPGNGAYDWFVEPNPLGTVTQINGRKAVRSEMPKFSSMEHAQYTIEIPGHGSAWNIDLRKSGRASTPFTADHEDADRRVLLAADALMTYDRT